MSLKTWEEKVLKEAGAPERVRAIEDELRLAAGLTALREEAGLSQREIARRIGVSQPRVAAIERSHNVTIDVLEQYVKALGGVLEVRVVKGSRKVPLLSSAPAKGARSTPKPARRAAAPRSRAQALKDPGAKQRSVAAAAGGAVRSKPARERVSAAQRAR